MRSVKAALKVVAVVVVVALITAAVFVGVRVRQFDASMATVYAVPLPTVHRSEDPAVIARGKHVAESFAACATADCHGPDFGGGRVLDMGPVGVVQGPNLTSAGLGARFSDGEIARVVLHGIGRDGRSVRFMPAHEINHIGDADLDAVISYLRSVPPVQRTVGDVRITTFAKVLDRQGLLVMDVARRIDHTHRDPAPAPSPTADYGRYLARACSGCHGDGFSGGPIPGTPPSMPVPRNLTPHATGIAAWSYDDFVRAIETSRRPDGSRIDPFMPMAVLGATNETERRALWAFLRALPPRPFGGR